MCHPSSWRTRRGALWQRSCPPRTASEARRRPGTTSPPDNRSSLASRLRPSCWRTCPARTSRAARATRRPGRSCQARTGRSQQRRRRSGRFPPCKARTRRCPSRGRSCRGGMRSEPRRQWCKRGPVGKPDNRPPTRGPSCSSSCQPRTGAAPPRPVGSSCPANTPCTPWRRRRPDTRPQGTCRMPPSARMARSCPLRTLSALRRRLRRKSQARKAHNRPG
mmetsp:Transcript_43522/g.142790  ORF Transcript_43522/g.142790 Transcript_43522/m.142790 type:complete len:220 (+) Transcript_43522:1203-1862(+)